MVNLVYLSVLTAIVLTGMINCDAVMPKDNHVTVNLAPYNETFKAFRNQYSKEYLTNEEEAYRLKIFIENAKHVERHNRLYIAGKTSFHLGINEISDFTTEEYKEILGYRSRKRKWMIMESDVFGLKKSTLPDTVDWRQKGYVTNVKNQGPCGSCWAFSTIGSLEGQHFKKSGKLVSLSVQQLVDCSSFYGNRGCNGGFLDGAFRYLQRNGSESATSYPYKAKDDKCQYNSGKVVAKCTGFVEIQSGSETELQQAVATVGPVSTAIDASSSLFKQYSGGVFTNPDCSSVNLGHGVLVVGYGNSEQGGEYWLVKNSWGEVWGEAGYVRMARNKQNECGIATEAMYPLV